MGKRQRKTGVVDVNFEEYPFKTTPYEHQIKSLQRSVHRQEYAYFLEMGLGKSKVLLDNAAILFY